MFRSARIKLTVWYTLILLLISSTISILFYIRTARTLEREYERIETRLQRRNQLVPTQAPHHPLGFYLLQEDLDTARGQIAHHLLIINGAIVFMFAAAGYVLSGKTLSPIQEAMEEQNRFVADAAHELRTPITAIRTGLEVYLLDKTIKGKAREVLRENLKDTKSLESLAESLLRLARLDDVSAIRFDDVSLRDMLRRVVALAEPLAKKKSITITQKKSHINAAVVKGDEGLLTELVLVLLDNAIKYSPPKTEVTIHVTNTKRHVMVSIKDSGIGIPREHIPHIFDRFYRAEQARTNAAADGYGLGLSIARKIVVIHKGSITVESVPDKGTMFTIKLPAV